MALTSVKNSMPAGSFQIAHQFPSCVVNGVKFITRHRDNKLITQNNGVCVPVDEYIFFERMEDVIVLNYMHNYRVILFNCIWYGDKYDARRRVHDERIYGTTSAYTAK